MHIATPGFWDLNFDVFFLLVLNARGKCLFKKKQKNMLCICLGHLEKFSVKSDSDGSRAFVSWLQSSSGVPSSFSEFG